jgi:membrane protein required for colicin V production
MENLQIIDWIFLLVLVISSITGLLRGFVKEAVSLAGLVLAYILAKTYSEQVGEWLSFIITSPVGKFATAFGLIFLGTLIAGALIGWLLGKIISFTGLSVLNHLLGGVFGCLRGIVLLLTFTVVADQTPISQLDGWKNSLSHEILSPFVK